MVQRIRGMRKSEGFTLIELLIVIVILGILAAVVVFAVNGISDRGQTSACDADAKALRVAEESRYAQNPDGGSPEYVSEAQLVTDGFISEASALHDITVPAGGASFTITNVAPC
jgi:general secretion pathway protein G